MMGDKIHVMSKDQIQGLRQAAKIAAATLKHALDNTKVFISINDNFSCLDRNEVR